MNAKADWHALAIEDLLGVVQALSGARNIDSIATIVREAARNLTGADGATFVLRDGDQCHYADENAISPLWKGKRFPMAACISGWAMLNAKSVVIEDIYKDSRIPADAYKPTFVKSLVMVPIRRKDPIGAIGNYWATKRMPTGDEVSILQALADATSVAMENARLYEELKQQVEELRAQRSIIQKQNDSLNLFARALMHDLKEPVRTISSFSDLMSRRDRNSTMQQDAIGHIKGAASRMGALVQTVYEYLQFHQACNRPIRPCEMKTILAGVLGNLAAQISEKRAIVLGPDLPLIEANEALMSQLIHHLIANSLHHCGDGVTIQVASRENSKYWIFAVEDDGPGIPSEYHDKIFEPFFRLAQKKLHAGLGLATCRQILDFHGGAIWCESGTAKGTKICFELPKFRAPSHLAVSN